MESPNTSPDNKSSMSAPQPAESRPAGGKRGRWILFAVALVAILAGLGGAFYLARQGKLPAVNLPSHNSAGSDGGGASPLTQLSAEEKKEAYEEEVGEVRNRIARLEAYLGAFPKSLYDWDALAQSFTTPQAAFEYVRDQVALEPYAGVMKGAQGTFLTRGGNDLDRAVLLAALLKQQNVSAKIAHGKLPAPQARSLLQQIVSGPDAMDLILKSLPKDPPATKLSENQREVGRLFRQRVGARGKELSEAVDQYSPRLESLLKTAGLAVGADATGRQVETLQDHYWVQANIDEQTVDLDPAFSSAQLGQKFAEAEETLDPEGLPDNLFQQIRFRVVAEHLKGGRTTSTDLVSQETNAVDLWGKNVRLALAPQADSPDVNEFQPSLVIGEEAVTGQPLQIRPEKGGGESAGEEETGNPLGGIGGVGSSGLQKPEAKKPKGKPTGEVLGRVYFEVTSTAPHLPDAHYRRVILDRLEFSQGKAQLQPALADDRTIRPLLLQVWDGAVSAGPFHPLYVFQTHIAALKILAPIEEKARADAYLGQEFSADDNPGPTLSPELVGYFFFSDFTHHQLQRQAAPHTRGYYERPRLAFYRHGLAIADWSDPGGPRRYQEGIDLLNAPIQFAGPQEEISKLALKSGIADTALERYIKANQVSFNALPLFAAAAEQKISVLTIGPARKATLESVAVSPAIKNVLQSELAEGRMLVLPVRLVTLNQTQTFGWWSIDPSTGYALGKMELGAAQGMVESTQMQERVAKWSEIFVKFYGDLLKCYMMGLASALGELDYYGPGGGAPAPGSGQGIILYHGKPGRNPMPTSQKIAECAIGAACEALTDVMNEMAYGGYGADAFEQEAHTLKEIIFNFAADQAFERGQKKALGAACEGALKSSMK